MAFVQISRFQPPEWRLYRRLRLAALAGDPDAFGSTYARSWGLPAPEWRERLRVDPDMDFPMCARFAGTPAGMGWVRREAFDAATSGSDVAHLYQMWAAPDFRGQGVGRALLDQAIAWARERADGLELGITWSDSPARRLYESAGFSVVGQPETLRPGSGLELRNMRLSFQAEPR